MPGYVWLSYPLNECTPAYGGGQQLSIEHTKNILKGDGCNTATWHLPNHLGTHVDTPQHFFPCGHAVDSYPPAFWFFQQVQMVTVDLQKKFLLIQPHQITPYLNGKPDLLLIKTGMGYYRNQQCYRHNNPGLSPELGTELRKRFPSLRAVGVDFISISSWQNRDTGRKAHQTFLDPSAFGHPLVLIEDMDLSPLTGDTPVERIIILPLRVENGDGAPCSIVAEVKTND